MAIFKISDKINAISFKNFSFIYGNEKSQKPAVSDINFNLEEGKSLVLAGPSGSGKSTISYAMNGLIPWRVKGLMKGDVEIFGKNIWDYDFMELSKLVGLVKQNPIEQLITFTVRDEIAFGLENLKYPNYEIEERIENVSKFMEINNLLDREVDQLSGGQKQLTILCSFLVMNPKILILDEPIAFLDQRSESLLLNRLKKLKNSREFNLTLIIIEHRLSRVVNIADKIVILDEDGRIHLKGTIIEILQNQFDRLKTCNIRVPWIVDLFNNFKKFNKNAQKYKNPTNFQNFLKILENFSKADLQQLSQLLLDTEIEPNTLDKFKTYKEKIEFYNLYIESLRKKSKQMKKKHPSNKSKIHKKDDVILETKNLSFEYPSSKILALKDINIKIRKGDFIGLVGPNGSGKTTLLYLLANLYETTSGDIFFNNKNLKEIDSYEYARNVGFIFQNPENMIFKPTIREEILYGPKNFGIINQISNKYISKLLSLIGKEDQYKNPFNLSWGQKRRLNLCSVFVYNPDIILLDEPFIGQDQKTIDSLIESLIIENKRGKTIIISSHDYHLLLKYTRRIIELNKDGTLKEYDKNIRFFTRHKNLGPIILLDKIKEKLARGLK